jgi:hypothetical protein
LTERPGPVEEGLAVQVVLKGPHSWEGLKEGGCRGHGDLDEDEGEVVAQVGCAGCDDGDGGQKVDGFDRLSESSLSPERTIE